MGIFKDWAEYSRGYNASRQILYAVSPAVWLRLHKRRMQRANRGWSDRDTWGAGEYIAKVTAEVLQHLNENGTTDWPAWFEYNVRETGKSAYSDLQEVITDINNYLEFTETSWSDGLEMVSHDMDDWFKKNTDNTYDFVRAGWTSTRSGRKLTDKQITARIKKHHNEEARLYKRATRAMQFFGRNFAGFWD